MGAYVGYHENFSVRENGIFYLGGGNLKFYDFQTKNSYVICSRPNCMHRSSKCSGWYERQIDIGVGDGAFGLAEHGGKLYCFTSGEKENSFDLVCMDLDGSHKRVITSLEGGDFQKGAWRIDQFGPDAYYCGNMVWLTLRWRYEEIDEENNGMGVSQCIGIDLKSGEVTEVTERSQEAGDCSIDEVSEEYLVLSVTEKGEPPLTEDAFYEAFEAGEFKGNEAISSAEAPYEAYWQWYFDTEDTAYSYVLYDVKKGTTSLLYEDVLKSFIEEDGSYSHTRTLYYFSGWYEGQLIASHMEHTFDGEYYDISGDIVYLWDVKTNRKKEILHIENGYVFDADNTGSAIAEGNQLFYMINKEDGKADYYAYNLKTGKSSYMYEAAQHVPFRILGETSEKFFCETFDDVRKKRYLIDIEDYHKGNFEAAERVEKFDILF